MSVANAEVEVPSDKGHPGVALLIEKQNRVGVDKWGYKSSLSFLASVSGLQCQGYMRGSGQVFVQILLFSTSVSDCTPRERAGSAYQFEAGHAQAW